MKTWTATDVFLGALRSLLFVRESPRNSNRGQGVDAFLSSCGTATGNPWCMALMSYVGRQCFASAWPLPMTAGCVAAVTAAKAAGLLVPNADAAPGDLVFLWSAKLRRHAHVFALAGPQGPKKDWPTLEGNTNDGGDRDGWGLFARRRTITPQDVVVRWSAALTSITLGRIA